MTESQVQHRHGLERAVVNGNIAAEKRGQVFSFLIGLVVILGGIFLLATGKSVQGLSTIILALGTLTGVFIYGRSRQEKERQQKRDAAE